MRKPNTDDITKLNQRTRRQVDQPREWSTERKVPRKAQPGVRPAPLAKMEKGTGRG